jgi:hypothetical protein
MKITVQESKKKNRAMLTIVYGGKSQTRHCQTAGDGRWIGHCLDQHKSALEMLQEQSAELTAQLFRLKVESKPYKMNTIFRYDPESPRTQYAKSLAIERHRAKKVIARQKEEIESSLVFGKMKVIDPFKAASFVSAYMATKALYGGEK